MSRKKKRQDRRKLKTQDKTSRSSTRQSSRDEFNPDYSYVIKDLRRIGSLAGTFLFVLIALAFLLR